MNIAVAALRSDLCSLRAISNCSCLIRSLLTTAFTIRSASFMIVMVTCKDSIGTGECTTGAQRGDWPPDRRSRHGAIGGGHPGDPSRDGGAGGTQRHHIGLHRIGPLAEAQ